MSTTGVRPRFFYNYSDAMNVVTRTTVAFQAICKKHDFQGPWRSRRIDAMTDWEQHKHDKHGSA